MMSVDESDMTPMRLPLADLERGFIDEYVRARGYDPVKLDELAEDVRHALLKDASLYASMKLSEVESRSHYVHELHDKG
jgi:hypothetical protein